jgi:hypothetical protein
MQAPFLRPLKVDCVSLQFPNEFKLVAPFSRAFASSNAIGQA